jgi:PAS domain-containing protein
MRRAVACVRHRTERTRSEGYKGPIDSLPSTGHTRLLADLILWVSAAKTCAQSGVMLARVRKSGMFELLTAAAWARALGYLPEELSGKSLRQLMQLETRAAREVVAALLDEEDVEPLEVTLRCKDERRKCFRLYRRFDPYEQAVFVVADEVSEERLEPARAYA